MTLFRSLWCCWTEPVLRYGDSFILFFSFPLAFLPKERSFSLGIVFFLELLQMFLIIHFFSEFKSKEWWIVWASCSIIRLELWHKIKFLCCLYSPTNSNFLSAMLLESDVFMINLSDFAKFFSLISLFVLKNEFDCEWRTDALENETLRTHKQLVFVALKLVIQQVRIHN